MDYSNYSMFVTNLTEYEERTGRSDCLLDASDSSVLGSLPGWRLRLVTTKGSAHTTVVFFFFFFFFFFSSPQS
jgi:hypothetical protein